MQVDYVSVYAARRHWGSCILVSRAIKRQELHSEAVSRNHGVLARRFETRPDGTKVVGNQTERKGLS
ncbi:hypothetical protein IFM46972_02585 [Aspergillus udagawae]|uniref:Uncharacterized protein n=1 Tax=Aspergillus udagawae TaxID=91492 RepID=A0A8H3RL30_9EURO|nr:hypothetical protein IFM46972_02585 [Aspergillus udagawae]